MKYAGSLLAAIGLAGALSVTGAAAEDLTITHAQGETQVSVPPETVVTFDYAALDTLEALGVEVDGLPGSNLPPHLAKYAGDAYAKVGSLFEPDYEAVAAMAPDLVIVAGRSAAVYPELSKVAPTVDLSNAWGDFIASVEANTRTLGTIFAKEAEAEALVGALEDSVAAVRAQAPDLGRVLVVLTEGGKVTAFGPGSRFGFVHDALGLTPTIADVEQATHGEAISFELIRETDPDWLIVIDRDAAIGQGTDAARQLLDNELVQGTKAWTNDHVVYVDPARWYVVNGGIANLKAMVDELADAFGA